MQKIIFPEYLYKKTRNLSLQVSPYAQFNPVSAINGEQAFESSFAPIQQPQKKQIYFDYNTFFRLLNKEERALIIAKLKAEGFSVSFIFQKADILTLAEIDEDLNIQIDSQSKNIFLLNDEDIEKLSNIDHAKAIDKLSLAKDNSIILSFAQFKELGDILSVNSWVEKDVYQSHLTFCCNQDQKTINKSTICRSFTEIDFVRTTDDLNKNNFLIELRAYSQLPNFNTEDQHIQKILNLFKVQIIEDYQFDKFNESLKEIFKRNPENLVKIFDFLFDSSFDNGQEKIDFQKKVVKLFWFSHPDLSQLISKAKTISGYESLDFPELSEEILSKEIELGLFDSKSIITDLSYERLNPDQLIKLSNHLKIDRIKDLYFRDFYLFFDYLMFFKKRGLAITFYYNEAQQVYIKIGNEENAIPEYLIIRAFKDSKFKKEFTTAKFLELHFEKIFSKNSQETITLDNLYDFYPEITNFDYLTTISQEKLIKKLQTLIDEQVIKINSVGENLNDMRRCLENFQTIFPDLQSSPIILKKLNFDQYLISLEQIIQKIDEHVDKTIPISYILMIINHHIDKDENKKLTKKILDDYKHVIEFIDLQLNETKFTPEFLDFLITLHQSGEIQLQNFENLKKYIRDNDSFKRIFISKQSSLNPNQLSLTQESFKACCHVEGNKFSIHPLPKILPSQHNQSPLQICLLDLNPKALRDLNSLITDEKIDPTKILSLKILGFNRLPQENPDISTEELQKNLLDQVIKLFPNLKHLKLNKGAFNFAKIQVALTGKNITYETFDYSLPITRQHRQDHQETVNADQQQGNKIFVAIKPGRSIASKSGNDRFDMVELGKIISRPLNKKHLLLLRDSCCHLKTDCLTLSEDWLPKITATDSLQQDLSIQKFLSKDQLTSYNPPSQSIESDTFALFTQDLVKGQTMLPSISVDNQIIGYYTDPDDKDIKFHKNDQGFFFVTCTKKCQITYILKGQEFQYQTLKDVSLVDLPDQIKQVINDYRPSPDRFPLSVLESEYNLPLYPIDQSLDLVQKNCNWLDQLFSIPNKGSCRHRVMAMAHKFQQANLVNGQDFRIVGINNNHVLLEVKNNKDNWITLDFGGQYSELNYQSGTYQSSTLNLDQEEQLRLTHEISPQTPSLSSNPNSSPNSPQAQSIDPELIIVQTKIDELYQLQKLKSLDDFENILLAFSNSQQKSLLLTSLSKEELKNYLLGFKETTESISTHFIASSQDMQIQKATIQIQSSEEVSISPISFLSQFIETAKTKPFEKHFLIIDWKEFDDKSRVAFNTMFDQSQRTINGVEIPDNLKIICLDDARSKITDPSILSRFDSTYDLSEIKEEDLASTQAISPAVSIILEFDCEGEENWQAKLFGKLVVNGQLIEFKKSEFTRNLDLTTEESIEFSFKNFSTKQQDEIAKLFAQASAQGFINYHGYQIKFPRNYSLQFDRTEFNFTEVLGSFKSLDTHLDGELTLAIHHNTYPTQQDIQVVNSYLFDQLLAIPEITDNQYHEQPGLIERSKGQTLKLFITEQLTPAQLYCILFNAKKHGVSLELYLAKDIKFEDQAFMQFKKSLETVVVAQPDDAIQDTSPSRITITNNVELEFDELAKSLGNSIDHKDKSINVVNVEDVLFSDLFSKPELQIQQGNPNIHFTFQQKVSEVMTKLDSEIVVLKGKFPNDLLSLLHPQILDLKTQYPNLYFIIEEQEIRSTSKASTQLAWLDRSKYAIRCHPNQAVENPVREIERTACINPEISDNSLQEAIDFISIRKLKLKKLLLKNSALQITGHSGVGKSSLLREVKQTGFDSLSDVSIREELTNFEEWAMDKSASTKILVIDEFNVDGSTNFTMFRDFVNAKDDSRRRIFYQGKFYQLDQNHKVVFLGNPHNYGNRYRHQLFSDCQIQEWQLADFSQSYIYQKILKEPIFDGLSEEIKSELSEIEFKTLSAEAIRKYYENNTKKSDEESDLPQETVRELQERILQEIVKKYKPSLKAEIANQNFISTQANQQTIFDLQTAIRIRKLQKEGDFPGECLGTPGVIFEGDSGIGKSVMIEAVIQSQGITALSSLDDFARDSKTHHYFKIDASSSYDKIKEQLFKAFELGVIVVIDELNTRIDEGLEKEINALLTGQHPTNPNIKMKPGFMIITSVNKASSAGRSNFSPAIKHRCTNISALPLSAYQVEDFTKIIVNWAEKDPSILQILNLKLVKTIAEKFRQLVQQDPKYNLRSLRARFNEIKVALLSSNQECYQAIQFNNPDLVFRYFNGNPQLNFFSKSNHDMNNHLDSNREQNSCFHFLNKNFDKSQPEKTNPKENIFQALKETKDQLGISEDDMIQFSILAVKHQGLGNVFNNQRTQGLIQEDFQKLFGKNWQEKKSQAIKFSAIFQKKLFEQNILTGRINCSREVGMRLKRLDPELLLEFLLKDQKLDIKKELIKDNFVNKLNKILNTSNQSLEDSIKTLITSSTKLIAR